MSKYTFTFKKDDIFVEFVTTDKEVVERQFQIWVADADDYAHNRSQKPVKVKTPPKPKEEEKITPPPIFEDLPVERKATEPEAKPEIKSEITGEKAEEIVKSVAQLVDESVAQPEVFDKASSLLKTINTIQNPTVEEEKPTETVNFDEVLEKTIENTPENPTFEPNRAKDQVFLNLINSKNTTDKFHYLMITAYYLLEFEKMERFSLKQINAKLMQNLSEVIDHTTLQEAINQNFIELVPDLTGTSEVGEYRITPIGEDFFANKI